MLCCNFQNNVLNENTVTVEIKVDPPAEDDAANTTNGAVSGKDPLMYKLLPTYLLARIPTINMKCAHLPANR